MPACSQPLIMQNNSTSLADLLAKHSRGHVEEEAQVASHIKCHAALGLMSMSDHTSYVAMASHTYSGFVEVWVKP